MIGREGHVGSGGTSAGGPSVVGEEAEVVKISCRRSASRGIAVHVLNQAIKVVPGAGSRKVGLRRPEQGSGTTQLAELWRIRRRNKVQIDSASNPRTAAVKLSPTAADSGGSNAIGKPGGRFLSERVAEGSVSDEAIAPAFNTL